MWIGVFYHEPATPGIFKVLARTQHMSKAAETLGISQPSLSYAIKKLEEELESLFEPDGRNIKLTPLGKHISSTLMLALIALIREPLLFTN